MADDEPQTKKLKTADVGESLCMNIRGALVKDYELARLSELPGASVSVLEGIGEEREKALAELKVKTVQELGEWKFFRTARAIVTLAATEIESAEGFDKSCQLNLNKALCKAWESKSLKEVIEAPPSALEGLTAAHDELLKTLQIRTIAQLGECKWAQWAEAMIQLSQFDCDHS